MTRITALAERQASLVARSHALREELAAHWSSAEPPVALIDGGLVTTGRWLRSPAVIGITVLLVVVLGRKRSLTLVRTALGLVPAALRLRSVFARR